MLKWRKKNSKGFSLVELIIVIAIMAILVGILAPQFIKYVNQSRKSTDVKNMQEVISAIQVYCSDSSHTLTAETCTITLKQGAALTLSVTGGQVASALTDAGLVLGNIKGKSTDYNNNAITATITTDGVTFSNVSAGALGTALGLS